MSWSKTNNNVDTVLIMEESWDFLIVLDACRYDYFERVFGDFLKGGQLSCRKSVGSCTEEWRKRSFPGYYADVVYVSSNPYINSLKSVLGFHGGEHFYRVIDVWQTRWDESRGTVLPEMVTREALGALARHPGKRMIVHYLQPHAPYLGFGSDCAGFPQPDVGKEVVLMGTVLGEQSKGFRKKIYEKLCSWIKHGCLLGNHPEWFMAEFLQLPPLSPMDAVRRKYGPEGLRRAYQENLEIVLKHVSQLLEYLKGKVVITSDHGEFLGEGRFYSHGLDSDDPCLRHIPWWTTCRADAVPLREEHIGQANRSFVVEEDTIHKRLKDLGYL